MCGIVAYNGQGKFLLDTLLNGLRRLEYRGYDSAGIAVYTTKGVYTQKAVGKVLKLEQALEKHPPSHIGSIGIAHTRWATHGAPTIKNAHPQVSFDKKIYVVHNGIIENYKVLKSKLEKTGIKFTSETDTEVIAQLISFLYHGDLRKAVMEAVSMLTGAFALAIISLDEPDRLIGVKMASPLVVGVKQNEVIMASDVSAIIDRTKNVIFLEDGEIIDIKGGSYEIIGFDNVYKKKDISHIDWNIEDASKEGFAHYLLKEIMEQPQAVTDSIRGRIVSSSADVKFGGLIDIIPQLKNINRVVLLGIGTTYFAAKLGELYFNSLANTVANSVLSSEFRYSKNKLDGNTWVIAISQSGETADTIAAINEAKRQGALVTGIVNVVGSTVSRITKAGVYNHIGPEISVASTKAFTSQSVILLLHAILLGRQEGLSFSEANKILEAVKLLPNYIKDLLQRREEIKQIAEKIYKYQSVLYIGRQLNYPIAQEGALKMKELAYIHAEGLSGGELKHGPIALIDKKMPVIALATNDNISEKMMGNISEIKARGGTVIAINNVNSPVDLNFTFKTEISYLLQPLLNNIVLQLIAYYTAQLRGTDIDRPRNLAKSVTVE